MQTIKYNGQALAPNTAATSAGVPLPSLVYVMNQVESGGGAGGAVSDIAPSRLYGIFTNTITAPGAAWFDHNFDYTSVTFSNRLDATANATVTGQAGTAITLLPGSSVTFEAPAGGYFNGQSVQYNVPSGAILEVVCVTTPRVAA